METNLNAFWIWTEAQTQIGSIHECPQFHEEST